MLTHALGNRVCTILRLCVVWALPLRLSQVAERAAPFAMRFVVLLDTPGAGPASRVVTAEDMQWLFAIDERLALPASVDPDDVAADKAVAVWRSAGATPPKEQVIRWLLRRMVVQLDQVAAPPTTQLLLQGGSVDGTAAAQPPATPSSRSHVSVVRNMRPSSASAAPAAGNGSSTRPGATAPSPAKSPTDKDWGRAADDIAAGRVRPSFGVVKASPAGEADLNELRLSGRSMGGALGATGATNQRSPTNAGDGGGEVGVAGGAAARGQSGAAAGGPGAPGETKWERYARQSKLTRRIGEWEERAMLSSGDAFYFNPVTRQGAFHIDSVDDPAVQQLEKRVLPAPPSVPSLSTPAKAAKWNVASRSAAVLPGSGSNDDVDDAGE